MSSGRKSREKRTINYSPLLFFIQLNKNIIFNAYEQLISLYTGRGTHKYVCGFISKL